MDRPTTEVLARIVNAALPGSTLLESTALSGGISAITTALQVRAKGGVRHAWVLRQPGTAALKRQPEIAQDEFSVLQATAAAGLITPRPVVLDASRTLLPHPYFISTRLPGAPDFAPIDRLHYAAQFGTQLARIHQLAPSLPARAGACAEAGAPVQGFDVAGIRQALLAQPPLPARNRPALLHGDYWPGNVLFEEGTLTGIVDWEDAALGDPLTDLGVSRLDVLTIFGEGALEAFMDAYRSHNPINETHLPQWDLCAALRLLRLSEGDFAGWASFFAPYSRDDITAASIERQLRASIAQALQSLK